MGRPGSAAALIVAGDIGGTSSRLALFDADLRAGAARTYASREYRGLEEILALFVEETGERCERACVGVPGPVVGGVCRTTNLPWVVDARRLALRLGIGRVALLNDLEASAHGIAALGPGDLESLNAGAPGAQGNAALIAAGTGLGEAGLYWDGVRHHPFACEGGHASFGPRDALEADFLGWLRARHGHVSWERAVSGPGLVAIYEFLREREGGGEPDWLAQRLRAHDPAAAITEAALEGRDGRCARALDRFVSLYGAEAGNLALKVMALGGVYVGGGIAPRILPAMRTPAFMSAFADKGRMRPLLESMPVRVVLNDRCALLGAARHALLGA